MFTLIFKHFTPVLVYSVVLPCWNEERHIGNTLENLLSQDLKADRIIVVDDGSTDRTSEILKSYPVEVVKRPSHTQSYIGTPEIARCINAGLTELAKNPSEFVLLCGSDHIMPHNYASEVIRRMRKDGAGVASGEIRGEPRNVPTGTGRMVLWRIFDDIGNAYPENYGWEVYLLWKANQMGYKLSYYKDILFDTLRPTGTGLYIERWYYYGIAYKVLGYPAWFMLYKAYSVHNRNKALAILRGYFAKYYNYYEAPLRAFVNKELRKKAVKLLLKKRS